jgi:hypothetical protein
VLRDAAILAAQSSQPLYLHVSSFQRSQSSGVLRPALFDLNRSLSCRFAATGMMKIGLKRNNSM